MVFRPVTIWEAALVRAPAAPPTVADVVLFGVTRGSTPEQRGTNRRRGIYSCLSAWTGSTRAAPRAGRQQAMSDTTARTANTPA
jgi:hypothetical protein